MEGLKKKRLKRKNWKSGEISLYKAVDIKGKQRVEGGREIRAGWAGQKHFPKDKIFLFFPSSSLSVFHTYKIHFIPLNVLSFFF
jgi:hypothetical protein